MPIKWADAPSSDDLADAAHFLSLLGAEITGDAGQIVYYPAKDLLRVAGVDTPLPRDNAGVRKYLERYRKGTPVYPCLIVPGAVYPRTPLIIAEGFHRVCAAYHLEEATPVATSRIWLAP
jgi:hypothetical protein